MMATDAGATRDPTISEIARRDCPSSTTSRQRAVDEPPCGTIAEWNFSVPASEARHWKKSAASAPRATCCIVLRSISPGAFARLRGCQLTAEVECSISIHGEPSASPRMKSAVIASS